MVVAIAGAAIAAGTIASGAIGASSQAKATRKAAQGQQEAADEAIALQREQWQQGREDIAPWRQAGVRALGQFENLARQGPPTFDRFQGPEALQPGQFAFKPPTAADMMQDPGYQFRLQQGQPGPRTQCGGAWGAPQWGLCPQCAGVRAEHGQSGIWPGLWTAHGGKPAPVWPGTGAEPIGV